MTNDEYNAAAIDHNELTLENLRLREERDRLVGALNECLRIVDEHDGYSNRIQMVIDAALAGSGKEPNV